MGHVISKIVVLSYGKIHFACIQHDRAKICNTGRTDVQLSRTVGRARLSRSADSAKRSRAESAPCHDSAGAVACSRCHPCWPAPICPWPSYCPGPCPCPCPWAAGPPMCCPCGLPGCSGGVPMYRGPEGSNGADGGRVLGGGGGGWLKGIHLHEHNCFSTDFVQSRTGAVTAHVQMVASERHCCRYQSVFE